MIEEIWNFKIQIIPIVLAILIVELPNWIRKLKKLYYVPIYFPIFPLRELNEELSYYLGEDYFIGEGAELSEVELKKLRKKIIIESIISTLISAVLIPSIAGFIFAFVFSKEVLIQSLIFIFIYKLVITSMAVWNFRYHAIASQKNIFLLILIYIGYIGVFIQMIRTSFNWAGPFIEIKNWSGMLNGLADLIFNKGIAQGVILAAVTAVIITLFTDKEIRNENLK
ncbi:MAG: hypothetical protein ACPG4W_00780 [Flavobacteriales bacterium]